MRPNKKTIEKYKEMVDFGCILCAKLYGVQTPACVHHFTGAGLALKNREQFLTLCHHHHLGKEGIHHIGVSIWQDRFGTQKELLEWYDKNKNIFDNVDKI